MEAFFKKLRLIPWVLSSGLAILLLLLFMGLHAFDQTFWRYYYSSVTQFGDRCRAGVAEWPGSFEMAEASTLNMRDAAMPHRGTSNPPRAYLGQFLRVDCTVPLDSLKPGSFPTINLGHLYGESMVLWNGKEILTTPSGQMVEFPLPVILQDQSQTQATITVVSRGLDDGAVGMATLRPPYLATDQKGAQIIKRFLSSVYIEQPMLRLGLSGMALILLAALWWFGMRYPDVIWIMTLAGCVCIVGGLQYSLAFNFSWKPWAERAMGVANVAIMYAQAMFLWTFLRSSEHRTIGIKSITVGAVLLTAFVIGSSDRLFYEWRLIVKTPVLFGVYALVVVIFELAKKYRSKHLVMSYLVRVRSALVFAVVAVVLLVAEWILDEVHGIYIHYQVHTLMLLVFCGALLRDIAARQQEYFVERSRRQAEELKNSRAKAIAETARFVAHDLQRPFQIVKMFMERISTVPASEREMLTTRFHATLITAESDAHQLIQDLMTFDEAPKLSISEFLLRDCLSDVLNLVSLQSPAIKIENAVAHDIKVLGRRTELSRVFQNLIQNAVEAMPGRGVIRVSCDVFDDQRCRITVFNSNSFVAERDRSRIFDFAFTSGKINGKGLGLAYVREVVEQHEGSIECTSTNEGTSFVFDLPLAVDKRRRDGLTVALVDDDLLVHVAWTLDYPDLKMTCFDDPAVFLAEMQLKPEQLNRFQLIVMDYRFRNDSQSGLLYAEKLKRLAGCPPIFMATQVPISIVGNEFIDGIIEKRPMSSESLRQLIENNFRNRV